MTKKGENLICKGQRVLTKEGRDNWDKIFRGKSRTEKKN